MPQAVAEDAEPPAIGNLSQFAVGLHAGNIGECFVSETVCAQGLERGLGGQLAIEASGETHLFVVGERLVSKDQNSVLIHGGTDCGQ